MQRSPRKKVSQLRSRRRSQRLEQSEKAHFCLQKVESPEHVSWSFLDFLYESDSEEESSESFNEIVRYLQPKFELLAYDSIRCPPQEEDRIVGGSDDSSEGADPSLLSPNDCPMLETDTKKPKVEGNHRIGTIIRKRFEDGKYYEGEVITYDPPFYKIQYLDGDQEEFDEDEMKHYYKTQQVYSQPSLRSLTAQDCGEKDLQATATENDTDTVEATQRRTRTKIIKILRRSRRLQTVERMGTIQVTGVRRSARLTGKS